MLGGQRIALVHYRSDVGFAPGLPAPGTTSPASGPTLSDEGSELHTRATQTLRWSLRETWTGSSLGHLFPSALKTSPGSLSDISLAGTATHIHS